MMKKIFLFFIAFFSVNVYGFQPIDDPYIVGVWNMYEGQGSKVNDSSGKLHTGIKTDAKWVTTNDGNWIYFDGVEDKVECPASSAWNFTTTSKFTAICTIYRVGANGEYAGLFDTPIDTNNGWMFRVTSSDYLGILFYGPNGDADTTTPLSLFKKYRVGMVVTGTAVKLYVNGLKIFTISCTGPIATTDPPTLRLGYCQTQAQGFNGYMRRAMIIGRDLSDQEMFEDFLNDKQPGYVREN